ncbi:PQQ-binding-like beta-propeller repeat protein [Verrucomicrobiales bacterium]|nr:PQQ-binding-like beta-propeller repeat protein [Verrucomicrobiales bacterium]
MKWFPVLIIVSFCLSEARSGEWAQWGGSSQRNNVARDQKLPLDWEVKTRSKFSESRHVKWASSVFSHGYRGAQAAPPAVASGKVFVGSNNNAGHIRELEDEDLAVMVCMRESDGAFLWQHSSKRLKEGKVHDWEFMSVCSTPYVVDDRLWYVNNRCEVVCLDTEGFHDGENDGITTEDRTTKADGDVVWSFDMRAELGVSPHNFVSSSITGSGDVIFLSTGNGVIWDHKTLLRPEAPSFLALDRNTGKIIWEDNSPGRNILHGSWSSPAYGVFDGVPQVIFAGGDGWLYSFNPKGDGKGGSDLLWKFDCNPKELSWNSKNWKVGRNNLIGFPVIYGGLIYIATGQEPEHGSGKGQLLCMDPTKRGDVSPQVVFNRSAPETGIPPKRNLACDTEAGDFTRENPNSALRWSFEEIDRCCGSPAIADNILVIGDSDGSVHCLDAFSGELHWTADTFSRIYAAPLIVDGHVYLGNEDGELHIFRHTADPEAANPVRWVEFSGSLYAPPIAVNHQLYVLSSEELVAIRKAE